MVDTQRGHSQWSGGVAHPCTASHSSYSIHSHERWQHGRVELQWERQFTIMGSAIQQAVDGGTAAEIATCGMVGLADGGRMFTCELQP